MPGGVIQAMGRTMQARQSRVAEDPFVVPGVVTVEVVDIGLNVADLRLSFLAC